MGRPPQKSVEDKSRIVQAVLKGEITIAEAARREGTSQTSVAAWREQFLAGGEAALAERSRHGPSTRERTLKADIEQLNAAPGETHMELRLWRKGGRSTRLRRARGS